MEQLPKYELAIECVIRLAERDFYDHIDRDTRDRVAAVFRVMCWLDIYFDKLPSNRKKQVIGDVLGYLNGDDTRQFGSPQVAGSLSDLRSLLANIPSQNKMQFLDTARQLMLASGQLSLVTNVREVLQLRIQEGLLSANLILLLADKLNRNPGYVQFFRQIGVVGELVDCMADVWSDKRNGEISVSPLKMFMGASKETLVRTKNMVRSHPNKWRLLRLASGYIAKHVMKQYRLKTGVNIHSLRPNRYVSLPATIKQMTPGRH